MGQELTAATQGSRWFDDAGLGLFIHWDHASEQGLEISWPMAGGLFALPHCQDVSPEQYHSTAATFDPQRWDPAALAELAWDAGMRYVVFTAKHHNGFAMFATQTSRHSVAHFAGRDLVEETTAAFRAKGFRIGLYFSLSDWSHPDYPPLLAQHRPYFPYLTPPVPDDATSERFRAALLAQLRELLTNYGRIDVVWFDGQWERSADWWDVEQIAQLCRSLQPGILINDRLPSHGDFLTPEQFVPAVAPGPRWESCYTMNESWGYNPSDTNYKSVYELITAATETVGRGGNLLLNVSPRGDGSLPAEQLDRLRALADWMAVNGEAIHGVEAGLEPWQFYGPSTRRRSGDGGGGPGSGEGGDTETVYCVLVMDPIGPVVVRGVRISRVTAVEELGAAEPLRYSTRCAVLDRLVADPLGELVIDVKSSASGTGAGAGSGDTRVRVLRVSFAPGVR